MTTTRDPLKLHALLVTDQVILMIQGRYWSTLDHISNGRVDIGLSAGWYQREADAYGVAFPTASVRVEMLEESVIVLKQMLRAENTNNNDKISFKGTYYNISNTECNPKTIQPKIPPSDI